MKCQECGGGKAHHPDPRTPPLDEGDEVLCTNCHDAAVDLMIEELETEIRDLKSRRAR